MGLLTAVLAALIVLLASGLFDLGSGTVTVPATTGERVDTAARLIHDAGLKVGDVHLTANPAPPGAVLSQDPPPDQALRRGGRVNLVVSLGSEPP
jgi:serine/threonine-protein kinase